MNWKHGFRSHPLYNVWKCMRYRCHSPNSPAYHHYGGRGITICKAWNSPGAFIKWASANGWQPGLTIERTNNNGPYSPANCCFKTQGEQFRNTSRMRINMEVARKIREGVKAGRRHIDLAVQFGVSRSLVWKVVNQRCWKEGA